MSRKVTIGPDAANTYNRRVHVDGSQWCKVYGWDSESAQARAETIAALLAASPPTPTEGEPVGEAGSMPGTDGFTMAAFRAVDVPIGTKLYASPTQPKAVTIDDARVKALEAELDEALEIARVFAKHWPYGHLPRDEALRRDLSAITPPSARIALTAALTADEGER